MSMGGFCDGKPNIIALNVKPICVLYPVFKPITKLWRKTRPIVRIARLSITLVQDFAIVVTNHFDEKKNTKTHRAERQPVSVMMFQRLLFMT